MRDAISHDPSPTLERYTAGMATDGPTRRAFLTGAAAAASAAAARPLSAQSARRVLGANDRINIGMIGVGGRGSGHVRSLNRRMEMKGDVKIVAISDIYAKRSNAALQATRLTNKDLHREYRDLLARSDVDGVFIATPDHWHAPMALDALASGKDVYLEKPVTLTIDEAKAVAQKVAETGGVLQVGCQHTSDKRHLKARQLIEDGWIGKPLWAQANYSRNSIYGEWNYTIDEDATAEDVGWETFLGSAPKRPFSADRYFRWRKYWDYSGGIATDLFYHRLTPLRQMMGIEFPTRVSGSGGIYVHKDREVPDTYSSTVEYQDSCCVLGSSMANSAGNQYMEPVVYGHKGTITFDGMAIVVEPEWQFEKEFVEKTGSSKMYVEVEPHDMGEAHIDNFLTCMRTRATPHCYAEFAYKIMTAIKLGVDSYREGKMMLWDPVNERRIERAPARPVYDGDGQNHEEPRRRFGRG